ncbi:monooxygenase family protein [Nocardia lijiangensis]|uniref:monooxygenase family protein n=1 Tax=Nocardia lijiangensis TaxID=299618 RepID=UPI003D736370
MKPTSNTRGASNRERLTVDLRDYPDAVVLYLGIKVRKLRGTGYVAKMKAQLNELAAHSPDGLLAHESFWWSFFPLHVGFRQFWRDPESLDRYAHSGEHRDWWRRFLNDPHRATSAWHEAYFSSGGMDLLYTDMDNTVGWARFAPTEIARGQTYSSRGRAGLADRGVAAPAVTEADFYAQQATGEDET